MIEDQFQDYYIAERFNDIYRNWFELERGLCQIHKKEQFYLDLVKSGKKYTNPSNSTLAYVLGITDTIPTDQVKTSGGSIPDIDSDFQASKRGDVMNYLKGKYGGYNTAAISTFGTLGAKSAIRMLGKALGYDIKYVNTLAEAIPDSDQGFAYDLDQVLEKSPAFKHFYDNDEQAKTLIDIAKRFEGLINNRGQHAAGIILCSSPIQDIISCFRNDDDFPVIEVDGKDSEILGLVKFDILGLETLDVIDETINLVKSNRNIDIDLDKVDLNDPKVYEFIKKNAMSGVFQFDQPEFAFYTSKFGPKDIEDITFLTSLNRPGPQAYKGEILNRRLGGLTNPHPVPEVDEILKTTDGIFVYQEQILAIAKKVCGFTGTEAEKLRKIIGKKQREEMAKEEEKFITLGAKNGFLVEDLEKLWKDIDTFASYGFNKSHGLAYSFLTFYCLYLKTYFYPEFLLSSLFKNIKTPEKTFFFINEARRFDMGIRLPDINVCDYNFKIQGTAIYLGLCFIKGFSESKAKLLMQEREANGPFKSFTDFYIRSASERVKLNKGHFESLIWLGAFDNISVNRMTLLSLLERLEDANSRNLLNINITNDFVYIDELHTEYPLLTILDKEYELTGLHISGNLFENVALSKGMHIGLIIRTKTTKTKRTKELMCFADVLNERGDIENLTFFSKMYQKLQDILYKGNIIEYNGKGDNDKRVSVFNCKAADIASSSKAGSNIIKYSDELQNSLKYLKNKNLNIEVGNLTVNLTLK